MVTMTYQKQICEFANSSPLIGCQSETVDFGTFRQITLLEAHLIYKYINMLACSVNLYNICEYCFRCTSLLLSARFIMT